jgi:hypothetical protein
VSRYNNNLNDIFNKYKQSNASNATTAPLWDPPDKRILQVSTGVPVLTVDMLPAGWYPWVTEAADQRHVPVSYVALALIVSAASAVGATRIAVAHGEWIEPSILWGMTVSVASGFKSKAQKTVSLSIEKFEAALDREYKKTYAASRAQYDLYVTQCKQEKIKPRPFEPPPKPRWIVEDTTIEALAYTLRDNPRGVYCHHDEIGAWIGSFNRYSGGDVDRKIYLKAYDGGSHTVDRVKFEGNSLHIPNAVISVFGGMVSDRLQRFIEKDVNDGLLSRFIFVSEKPPEPVPEPRIADTARQARNRILTAAFTRLRGLDWGVGEQHESVPVYMWLTPEAYAAFDAKKVEIGIEQNSRTGLENQWLGKNTGRLLRLSLIFELLDWAGGGGRTELALAKNLRTDTLGPKDISFDAVRRAIGFLEFITAHFRKVMQEGSEPPEVDNDIQDVLRLLVEQRLERVTVTDIGHVNGFRWFRGINDAGARRQGRVLKALDDYEIIQPVREKTGRGDVVKIAVNPGIFDWKL